jgi:hypothetical protein
VRGESYLQHHTNINDEPPDSRKSAAIFPATFIEGVIPKLEVFVIYQPSIVDEQQPSEKSERLHTPGTTARFHSGTAPPASGEYHLKAHFAGQLILASRQYIE